jgi:hypothetical protein
MKKKYKNINWRDKGNALDQIEEKNAIDLIDGYFYMSLNDNDAKPIFDKARNELMSNLLRQIETVEMIDFEKFRSSRLRFLLRDNKAA